MKKNYGCLLDLDSKFILLHSLLGAVKFTKDANSDNYSCSGYGIVSDTRGTFSLSDSIGFGKNVTIFGVDNRSSVQAHYKKKIYSLQIKV